MPLGYFTPIQLLQKLKHALVVPKKVCIQAVQSLAERGNFDFFKNYCGTCSSLQC